MYELNHLLNKLQFTNQHLQTGGLISGIAYQSQRVETDYLFVCIQGKEADGHTFLQDANQRGAKAAIVEYIQPDIDIPQYQVDNSRIALAKISSVYFNEPSKNLNVIGVTATNGKTSTTHMIDALLTNNQYNTGLIGTLNVKLNQQTYPAELTTPESLESQYFMKRMTEKNVSHVTMEVSSIAQAMHRNDYIDYDIVTFNNIGREHIDDHGSFENYFAAKSKLIRQAKPDSFAILNLDDDIVSSLADQTEANVFTFGINQNNADLICKDLDLSTGRPVFSVSIQKPVFIHNQQIYEPQTFNVKMNVPGIHSVYNAMAAISTAILCAVPIPVIQSALNTFTGVKRRFQLLYDYNFKIIDDHFANPKNIDITMETLDQMMFNDLHMVYAIRGQRGATVNRENAEKAAQWARKLNLTHIIATKSVSNVTRKDRVTHEEADVFLQVMSDAGMTVTLYDELDAAIDKALSHTKTGDIVLLAGCQGMDDGAEIAMSHTKTTIG